MRKQGRNVYIILVASEKLVAKIYKLIMVIELSGVQFGLKSYA